MKPGYRTIIGTLCNGSQMVRKEWYKHVSPKTSIRKDDYRITITYLSGGLGTPLPLLMYFRFCTRKAKKRGIE